MAKTSLWQLSVLATFVWIAVGCGSGVGSSRQLGPDEYMTHLQKTSQKTVSTFNKIVDEPWPKITGLPKEERLKVLSGRAKDDAKLLEAIAKEFKEAKPPASHAAAHAAVQQLLDGLARIKNAYAEAIAAGQSAEATEQNQEYYKFSRDQEAVVQKELEKLGEGGKKISQGLSGLKN